MPVPSGLQLHLSIDCWPGAADESCMPVFAGADSLHPASGGAGEAQLEENRG